MVARTFDLVVIGTGAAATTVATLCREAGWEVAVIDSRPYGGTCALRGCDPKRVLSGAAEVIDWCRRANGKGVRPDGVSIEWPELMRFKRTFTEPVPAAREEMLRGVGIGTFHGRARFIAPAAVEAGGDTFSARHIVVASGARPAALGIPGESLVLTSDDFLELERLPAEIAFIGGGYIAFEFAHVAVRAGARVSILHRGSRPLERFDGELVERLAGHTRKLGIDLRLNTQVTGVERVNGGYCVHARCGKDATTLKAGLVVHAAGRVADTEDLNLRAAGIEATVRGITVNEYLQSVSNPAVYAAGDAAASGAPLTPVAAYHGRIVAENLLNGNRRKPDYSGMATVVFSIPPLAAVGLTEGDAAAQRLSFTVQRGDTSSWYSSRRVGETCSGYKILVEKDGGRLLGAHLLGGGAEEVINVFVLAIRHGMRAADLREVLYAYPTHGSDIRYML